MIFKEVLNKNEIDILYNQKSTFNDFSYKYDEETINFLKENLNINNSLYLLVKENNSFSFYFYRYSMVGKRLFFHSGDFYKSRFPKAKTRS